MWRARINPGVDEGKPVQAARLETPAPVPPGAGVGVASKRWLRDNALDAHERSETQWFTPSRALLSRCHPMAVQFGVGLTGSPPLSLEESVQIKRRLALQHVVDRPGQFMRQDGQGFALAVFFLQAGEQFLRGGIVPQE